MAPLFLGIAAIAASVVAIVFYREAAKVRDEIVATPTSTTSSIEKPGYYEVKGTADSDNPVNDPRTQTPCVFFHHKLTRTMRESHYSGGRNSRSDRTHTIMDDHKGIPFFLHDESGSIGVDGTSAEIHGELIYEDRKQLTGMEKVFATTGMEIASCDSVRAIPVGTEIYVIGPVEIIAGEPCFVAGERPFIITNKSEEEFLAENSNTASGFLLAAIALGIAGPCLLAYYFLGS